MNKESKDVETLLRMCAFDYYIKGTDNQFELTGYKGKISTLLDSFQNGQESLVTIKLKDID